MFLVFNKEKIYSYLVAISTVAVLFIASGFFIANNHDTVETAGKVTKKLPIYSVQTNEKKVAFTMNCAWEANDIDSILDTLKKCDVKITFFMVGDFMDKNPEAVKKVAQAGHEIANHSDTHPHVNKLSIEKNEEEIKKCSEKIRTLTGQECKLYRGPYGEYNDTVITAAENQNCQTIQWSLDTLDYSGLTGDQMWERLKGKLTSGSIILSHNGTKHTADSLEMLINNIKKEGYQVVKVSDLIYQNDFSINSNGMQLQTKKVQNENKVN